MRLYPEKLPGQLQQQLLPVYLVSGDEPLLLQECSDLIRQRAREQGCTDREVIDAGVSGFNWQDILHSATSMSLFAERKLIELRLPSGKPGAPGSSGTRPWTRPAPLSRYGRLMPGNCPAGCSSECATRV